MSLTNWKTWASGDILTASDMNAYLRDNGRWLSHNATGGAPMCRVYNSATLSAFTSGNAVTFNSERFDLAAMHAASPNPSRITVPASSAGKYLVGAHVRVDGASPSNGRVDLSLSVNNTTTYAYEREQGINVASEPALLSVVSLIDLAAADYVEASVAYSGFSSVSVTASSDYGPEFWAIWLGE